MFGSSSKNRRKESRKERRRRRWQTARDWARRIGLVAGLAVVAFGLPALIFLGYSHLMESDYFALTYVDVEELQYLDEDELLESAEQVAGQHILDVQPGRLEAAMNSLPFVAGADVERRFPDRLYIAIDEHEPTAIVVDDGFWLVDEGGEVIHQLDEADRRAQLWELPLVTGLTRAQLETTEGRDRLALGLEAYRHYRRMGLDERQPVSEIRVDDLLGVSLVVGETGTEVRLGRGRFSERLEQFAVVQQSLIRRGMDAAYVLVDHESDLSRVTVGKRTEPSDGEGAEPMD